MRALIALAVASELAYLAGALFSMSWTDGALDEVVWASAAIAAAALCALRARLAPGSRATWTLLGIAILSWFAGALVFDVVARSGRPAFRGRPMPAGSPSTWPSISLSACD